MWVVMPYPGICALQADAGFAVGLQCCDELSVSRGRPAAAPAVGTFGHPGCTGRVEQNFGDHPETAVIRTRCGRAAAETAFAKSAPEYRSCAVPTSSSLVRGARRTVRHIAISAGRPPLVPVRRHTDPNYMRSVTLRDDRYDSEDR